MSIEDEDKTKDDDHEDGLEGQNQEENPQEDQSDELVREQENDDNDQHDNEEEDQPVETEELDVPARNTRSRKKQCNNCCCNQHCQLTYHTLGESQPYISTKSLLVPCELESVKLLGDYQDNQQDVEVEYNQDEDNEGTFAGILMSVTGTAAMALGAGL